MPNQYWNQIMSLQIQIESKVLLSSQSLKISVWKSTNSPKITVPVKNIMVLASYITWL